MKLEMRGDEWGNAIESVNISVVVGQDYREVGGDKGRDYLNTCYNSTTHAASENGSATGCFGSQNKDRVSHPSMQILCQS